MASPNTIKLRSSAKGESWHRTTNKNGELLGFAPNGKVDRVYRVGLSGGLERFPKKVRTSKKQRIKNRRALSAVA